jgi:hypothetical protein
MAPRFRNTESFMADVHPEFRIPQSAIRNPVPSRLSNPFATCWTRPGAIPYRFPPGQSAAQLVEQLGRRQWWGEIVGPHGSGKSTLLATLLPRLPATGCDIRFISLHDGQRRLPRGWVDRAFVRGVSDADVDLGTQLAIGVRDASHNTFDASRKNPEASHTLLVIDGYEQLAPWWRWWLRRKCRRAGAGLLVTSHAPAGLPPLASTSPDLQVVQRLVDVLARRVPSPVTRSDVVASHACHGSNVREILFDLYDRHEQRMREMRTSAACGT